MVYQVSFHSFASDSLMANVNINKIFKPNQPQCVIFTTAPQAFTYSTQARGPGVASINRRPLREPNKFQNQKTVNLLTYWGGQKIGIFRSSLRSPLYYPPNLNTQKYFAQNIRRRRIIFAIFWVLT